MSPYNEIESIISDYDLLKQYFMPNSAVMHEFPKMLLMSIVSLFEVRLKTQLSQIITKVDSGSLTTLPNISVLRYDQRTSDFLYRKFYTFNMRLQREELTAQPFYNVFGGQAFINVVRTDFNNKRSDELIALDNEINKLLDLAIGNPKYEAPWIEKVDEKDTLTNLNFEEAERSFLSLKLRRNRLAHDYINGLSDTFEDINLFYRKSQIYVSVICDYLSSMV